MEMEICQELTEESVENTQRWWKLSEWTIYLYNLAMQGLTLGCTTNITTVLKKNTF